MDNSSLWDDEDLFQEPPQPLRASWDPLQRSGTSAPARRSARPGQARKRRSALGWFVHRYGWRAYGIPVLTAATVVAIVQMAGSTGAEPLAQDPGVTTPVVTTVISGVTSIVTLPPETVTVSMPAPENSDAPRETGPEATDPGQSAGSNLVGTTVPPDPNDEYAKSLLPGKLPPGGEFVKSGDKTFRVIPGTTAKVGAGSSLRTYAVEIENGVTVDGGDAAFAAFVDSTLDDARSWTSVAMGDIALQRVDPEVTEPDFLVTLTSQMTIRELCGYTIKLEASCYNSAVGRVLINDARFVRGSVSYAGDVGSYRRYAINHEVGHALGFGHQPCAEDGGLAPVMMQQSWSVANNDLSQLDPQTIPLDGKVCKPNPWPDPLGGQGASSSGAVSGGG